jgi:hypothetical protein
MSADAIKKLFGRIVGRHENKNTVVVEGSLWKCTKCKLIFIAKSAGEQHPCQDQKVI